MRILGLDLETTGIDTKTARITEIGVAIWDSEEKRPLTTVGMFLFDEAMKDHFTTETGDMMKRLSGITPPMLAEFGVPPKATLEWLDSYCERHTIEYICGHNIESFDRPLLLAELERHSVPGRYLRGLPCIDTRHDLPFLVEPDSRKLKHLALDAGFINPFSHRAVFDVLTTLKILAQYDIQEVLDYKAIPTVTVRAVVSYDNKELAKARRYQWQNIGDRVYKGWWVKSLKADKLEAEQKEAGFQVIQIE